MNNQKGFTFVELLIIMIVIAILGGIGIQFVLSSQEDKAKLTNAKTFLVKDVPGAIYSCILQKINILNCTKFDLLRQNVDERTEWNEDWRVGTTTVASNDVESLVLCYPLGNVGSKASDIADSLSVHLTQNSWAENDSSFTFIPANSGIQTGAFDGCTGLDYAVQYVTRN